METVTIVTNEQECKITFRYNQDILNILKEFKKRKYIDDLKYFSLPLSDLENFKNRLKENIFNWRECKEEALLVNPAGNHPKQKYMFLYKKSDYKYNELNDITNTI